MSLIKVESLKGCSSTTSILPSLFSWVTLSSCSLGSIAITELKASPDNQFVKSNSAMINATRPYISATSSSQTVSGFSTGAVFERLSTQLLDLSTRLPSQVSQTFLLHAFWLGPCGRRPQTGHISPGHLSL